MASASTVNPKAVVQQLTLSEVKHGMNINTNDKNGMFTSCVPMAYDRNLRLY